jgi:DNA-binding MarR family transcriptional regulator
MKRRSWTTAEVMNSCAMYHTRKAARAITALYDQSIAPCGIRATQFSALVAIAEADGAPVTEIAAELMMDRSTLTREMRTLEEAGLVRVTVGADRRSRIPTLTKKGSQTLAAALPLWAAAQDEVEERLGGRHWERTLEHLQMIAGAAKAE